MAWNALTFSFGSKLTSTKMTQLQANFAAMAAGESGAPGILETTVIRVVEAAIAPGSTDVWTKMAEVEIWIPANIVTLNCRCRMKESAGGTGRLRMFIQASSTGGTDVGIAGAVFNDFDISIDPDAADKGAWAIIEFQGKILTSSRTITLHKDEETTGGVQRNYAGASYFS